MSRVAFEHQLFCRLDSKLGFDISIGLGEETRSILFLTNVVFASVPFSTLMLLASALELQKVIVARLTRGTLRVGA